MADYAEEIFARFESKGLDEEWLRGFRNVPNVTKYTAAGAQLADQLDEAVDLEVDIEQARDFNSLKRLENKVRANPFRTRELLDEVEDQREIINQRNQQIQFFKRQLSERIDEAENEEDLLAIQDDAIDTAEELGVQDVRGFFLRKFEKRFEDI